MSYWNAKYKNDCGKYEITFASKQKEETKAVEKLCQAIIDKRVKSTDDVIIVRHGRWVIEKRHIVSRNPYIDDNYFASATCSECDFCIHAETKSFGYPDLNTTNYCPNCGAKMDGGADDVSD